jgi:hypothetical protein
MRVVVFETWVVLEYENDKCEWVNESMRMETRCVIMEEKRNPKDGGSNF